MIKSLQEEALGAKERHAELVQTAGELRQQVGRKNEEIGEMTKALILERANRERGEQDVAYYQGLVGKKEQEIEEVSNAKRKLDKHLKEEVDKAWIECEEKVAKVEQKVKAEESKSRALESKCRAMFEETDVLRNEISSLNSYYKLTFEKNKAMAEELLKQKSEV